MYILEHGLSSAGKDNPQLVVWSGGCDSTLLLNAVAEKFSTKEKPVTALSIDYFCIQENKKKSEEAARNAILDELKNRGLHINHHTITITGNIDVNSHHGITQAYLWATTVLPYAHPDSNIYLGYIRTDDVWHHSHSLFETMKWGEKVLCSNFHIWTPMEFMYKQDVIQGLIDKDLYDLTWYCELPPEAGKACGRCKPCRTHEAAIIQLALDGNEWAQKRLPKELKYVKKYGRNSKDLITVQ